MTPDPSIDNDVFKFDPEDFEAIRHYLELTPEKGAQMACLAAHMAPKPPDKFTAAALVKRAFSLEAETQQYLTAERENLIRKMNLHTLMQLHRCLHGEDDRDLRAELHPERLAHPLAGPLIRRMWDLKQVQIILEEIKEREWRIEFDKVADGNGLISLSAALKLIFPRSGSSRFYYDEYRKKHKDPFSRKVQSASPLERPLLITFKSFAIFATELWGYYKSNKEALTKKAQRLGGKIGGKKSAAKRAEEAAKEAARVEAEALANGISGLGSRGVSEN